MPVTVDDLDAQEQQLHNHLVEVLCYFLRQHTFRAKGFLLSDNLPSRVAQLMTCPQKHLKLIALKYFRTCLAIHDPFHHRQIIQNRLLEPILDILYETMPKDNLLNSACLEFFEFIKRVSFEPEALLGK
jgi:protein phosphatase-4 regulatory subunit 3